MTAVDPTLRVDPRTVADALRGHGDATALVTATETLSYAELDVRVDGAVLALGPARRLVLVPVDNTVDSVVAYLAALRGGHPAVLTAAGDGNATAALTDMYEPDIVMQGGVIAVRHVESARDLHPELALLLSTSGSTGTPKLVRLSDTNLLSNAAAIGEALAITQADRAITTLPMHYCYGLSVLNSYLLAGASVVLSDLSVVDPYFWSLARERGVTSFAGVPHTFELLDRIGFTGDELPSLRYVTQAGGAMTPERVRRYAQLGARKGFDLHVMYGQTEATARMACLPPRLAATAPDTIGIAVPGGALRIDAPSDDGVGELVYAGPNVMLGYAEKPDDLARGAVLRELRTGDLARRTEDGLFQIVGRTNRFVKPFGVRIDLDHLERALATRGFETLCTGDDERVVAAAVAASDLEGLRVALDEVLGLPRRCVTVVELEAVPRTASGKVDYAAVRAAAAPPSPPRKVHSVGEAFALALGVTPAPTDTFISLGGDSLSYVEVSLWLEELFGDVPRDWHAMPVAQLEARRPVEGRSGGAWTTVDVTVVMRAAFIVLIVGTHTGLWHQQGGAHALLALAGYNCARFQLTSGKMARSVARIAVPSILWIGAIAAVSDKLAWPHALLVNDLFGATDAVWSYWFIEAMVQIGLPLAAVFSIARVKVLERRQPFLVAAVAVALGLVARFDLVASPADHLRTWPHEVFWLFALGWAAARATATWQRAAVAAVSIAAVPGFFVNGTRSALVLGALALLVWAPIIRFPRSLLPVVTPLAGASLYIYLTHIQIHPVLGRAFGPIAAAGGSLVLGVVAWRLSARLTQRITRRRALHVVS